ncbi:MAG: R3H domain-containing nucleic acid-binding protein [Marmoricola sp.]
MSEPVNETIEAGAETAPPATPQEVTEGVTEETGSPADSAVAEEAETAADAETGDDTDEGEGDEESARPGRRERLEQEGDIAADYLEELLEITDLDGDLDMDVEGDRATVSIVGANLPQLVGEQGEVLEALQELTRLAVYRETGERSRLMLDVSGHRAERRTALEVQAAEIVAQVKDSGEQASLEPMSPFERKVVHDVVSAAGLKSESEGAEPKRYVVVLPA